MVCRTFYYPKWPENSWLSSKGQDDELHRINKKGQKKPNPVPSTLKSIWSVCPNNGCFRTGIGHHISNMWLWQIGAWMLGLKVSGRPDPITPGFGELETKVTLCYETWIPIWAKQPQMCTLPSPKGSVLRMHVTPLGERREGVWAGQDI